MFIEDVGGHGDFSMGRAGGGSVGGPWPVLENDRDGGSEWACAASPLPLPSLPSLLFPPPLLPLLPPSLLPPSLLPSLPRTPTPPSTMANLVAVNSSAPLSLFSSGGNRRRMRLSMNSAAPAATSANRLNTPNTAATMIPHLESPEGQPA